MQTPNLDMILGPKFWMENIKYVSCFHFVLNHYDLLLEAAPHLQPKIMRFPFLPPHFFLELLLDDKDRFIIDPENAEGCNILGPYSYFFVGRLSTCSHWKKPSYESAEIAQHAYVIWKAGILLNDQPPFHHGSLSQVKK